ncbi:hypothetical protein Q0Z83_045930 [Actinoplanes sichuanensis]|uniref:Uncharacterized protein n=1 Tax=Actinoplanes sichuanensis TaxID=512349 RepID=A0ABW4A9S6_9ACTN|nr:hypothetical protein [Actinoplanes sichuanensis]BEL06402.1 hypothetical protein Q0Z83_045930 [Actinoplanes sichuanensis]
MSVHAVVFRVEEPPVQDAQPRPETDRSTQAMQRLRNPFHLDLRGPDGNRA